MNPHARGMFLGLTAQHERGHLVRAVMEGATLAAYDAFDVLRSLGARPETVILCGGGSQSALWRHIVADVFGLPARPLLTVEQSALGAALLAGAGLGLFNPAEAAERWATYGEAVQPDSESTAVYARLLPVFRDAYRKHVDDFETLSAIAQTVS
jgi:xylulokinase